MKTIKNYLCILLFSSILWQCSDFWVQTPGSHENMEDFEATWVRVNQTYPFFALKKIDWDSLYTLYQGRVAAAEGDEFYWVLGDLLAELKDGHVYYRTPGGSEVYPFYPRRHFKDRHAYSPFVVRRYFTKELLLTASTSAEYQILPENIGYVFLSNFHDDYLVREFAHVLDFLKDTQGLIIDIRQKRGGNLQNVETVVSRFISSPLEWPKFYSLGALLDLTPIEPRGPFTYTNPVVVLVNGSTFSAGELTTELLKQIPQVTILGDTTGGGGGISANHSPETLPEFELPSGKRISVPSGYIERYDGVPFEWNGILPDIRVPQTENDIKKKRDRQLEYAIQLLK
ncbi:MAG: hypothetical protein JXQ65_08820 [Candidatus Marinimicrobia bacterium]|nr:hypothetical protein [Candidatus Neomarinimicrobiota bacterium]